MRTKSSVTSLEHLGLSLNDATLSVPEIQVLPLSSLFCLERINSALNVLGAVQSKLDEQAKVLVNFQRELDKIDSELRIVHLRQVQTQSSNRIKSIRKPKRQFSIAKVLEDGFSSLSDGEMDVEMHLGGMEKTILKNTRYRNLMCNKQTDRFN